jgi:large subunit ribosomal protein L31e
METEEKAKEVSSELEKKEKTKVKKAEEVEAEEVEKPEEEVEKPEEEVEKPEEEVEAEEVEEEEVEAEEVEEEEEIKEKAPKKRRGERRAGKEAVTGVLERVYTIPFRCVKNIPKNRRARRAIKEIRIFTQRHMKSDNIWIDNRVNALVWARGAEKPPSKIKVKATKFDDGLVEVVPLEE